MKKHKASIALRRTLRQAFIPIFVSDGVDPILEVEACLEAGMQVIEFTLRRPDSRKMIPEIRKRYPELTLLIGSTMDSETMVARNKCRCPQLMTLQELEEAGADGFVSMLDFTPATLGKYHKTHLLIPTASTVAEAFRLAEGGAHCIKILGSYENTVKTVCSAPAFSFAPVFVTGGMTPETMPRFADYGAAFFAAGFDIMVKDRSAKPSVKAYAKAVSLFAKAASEARARRYPDLDKALDRADWKKQLPWALAEDI